MIDNNHTSLKNQIHIYSLDTGCFYTETEQQLHNRMLHYIRYKNLLNSADTKDWSSEKLAKKKLISTHINQKIREYKQQLTSEFPASSTVRRTLQEEKLTDSRIISIFESTLTRTAGMKTGELTTSIIVVQTFFYDIIEQLIKNGFSYQGEAYRYFTSSAGQIRTKKTVFIKESLWQRIEKTLMCGLSIDTINQHGGINVNKYLAYLALSNSATEVWEDFDIQRCIVVPDFETSVNCEVDFIHDDTYQVERKFMDVPIPHTDGCGMILPRLSKKNFMVRLPWVKGLLASFDFVRFIREHDASPVIQDIYGKEWDIIQDRIQIILTKSQFKMYQYYDSWEEYQQFFKMHNCQAGICNMEEDHYSDATINYQMLQTLTDITDDEIDQLVRRSQNTLERISSDKQTILRIFGVVPGNSNKTWLQQALELYPEMLQDEYCRARLREIKKSLVREFRAGKLEINGKYTFLVPDLYAFCEHLFLGNPVPTGLLSNGQVSCRLFSHNEKLDCLRSPHLYREHAIRRNTVTDTTTYWFRTNAIYTSTHDPISKILQFDVDGDRALVVADKTLVKVAERNIQNDHIVPLYYDMKKAQPTALTSDALYRGLNAAYTGGNIGYYSNSIAKVFNYTDWSHATASKKEEALNVIKLLCMENNFCIDMAKTLYMPKRPPHINDLIQAYTKKKLPHFFQYAKGKTADQTEPNCQSLIDKLENKITYKPIRLTVKDFGKFSYTKLMQKPRIQIDQQVIDKYNHLNRHYHFRLGPEQKDNIDYVIQSIRKELLDCGHSESEVCDMLVRHLYTKKTPHKELLWQCFGHQIVANLQKNVPAGSIQCRQCGLRFLPSSPNQKYCDDCRGYKPKGTKTITCVDCCCKIEVDAKDTATCRCELHRKEHQRMLKREQNRRAYERRKQIQ